LWALPAGVERCQRPLAQLLRGRVIGQFSSESGHREKRADKLVGAAAGPADGQRGEHRHRPVPVPQRGRELPGPPPAQGALEAPPRPHQVRHLSSGLGVVDA
jgi:hypothetical protein